MQRGRLDLGAYESPYSVDTEPETASPATPLLSGPYPNPFASVVTLTLLVPQVERVEVEVLNTLGQRVRLLHSGPMASGTQHLTWDSTAHPAGLYLIRASGDGWQLVRRAVRAP